VVLELGPGSGNQLHRFDTSKVSKIYGIEPNIDLHEALRATVKKTNLDDIYTIIPHGAEDVKSFERYKIAPNSVDTILSIQVLCSVPNPTAIVRHLYQYLKPGGKMIVYEHVQSKDFVTRTLQSKSGGMTVLKRTSKSLGATDV
jgi:tRNA A58 N-methylase Trm61